MVNWTELLQHIQKKYEDHKEPDYVPACPGFPLKQMYSGQARAVAELRQHHSAVLASHTGSGKTAVFLTLTHGQPSLVIEPRKFLQKQVAAYRVDTILFGRNEYPCFMAENAGVAPCVMKVKCDKTDYARTCEHRTKDCLRNPCKVFLHERELHRYPCVSCAYNNAMSVARGVISHGGTVICNFGNFWQFVRDAELIVIDEADLFYREISSPEIMRHCKDPDMPISKMVQNEIRELEKQKQTCTSKQFYAIQNRLYRLSFLDSISNLCFTYKKKNLKTRTENIYVEVNPSNVNLMHKQIFGNKKTIIVTATPGDFGLPVVTYNVHQRCGIYYTPVGKLTSRELQRQPWLLKHAADFIDQAAAIFGGLYDSKRFVIHCGNIGNHATGMRDLLNAKEGKDVCTMHEAGNLMGTIDQFLASDKKYLLVASAEYGADFTWCNCQFILKFPYASYDERMKALERTLGKAEFKKYYDGDAINREVQQAGRNGRGWDDFGITFIVDGKHGEIYKHQHERFPENYHLRYCNEVF